MTTKQIIISAIAGFVIMVLTDVWGDYRNGTKIKQQEQLKRIAVEYGLQIDSLAESLEAENNRLIAVNQVLSKRLEILTGESSQLTNLGIRIVGDSVLIRSEEIHALSDSLKKMRL